MTEPRSRLGGNHIGFIRDYLSTKQTATGGMCFGFPNNQNMLCAGIAAVRGFACDIGHAAARVHILII